MEELVKRIITAVKIPAEEVQMYEEEYLDQLATGDCGCLLDYLSRSKGKKMKALADEVKVYRRQL